MEENNLALLAGLDDFAEDRGRYDSLLDTDAIEQINAVRVTKKEVIDTADLMDKWTGIMLHHDQLIEESDKNIDDIMKILNISKADNQAIQNEGDDEPYFENEENSSQD